VTLPAAGWFPDPRDTARLRWWDGGAWWPHPRRPVEAVRPIVVTPTGPAFSVLTRPVETRTWSYGVGAAQRFCVMTCLAVVLAVVSVALNPWGACSVLGFAAGLAGLVHPNATGAWRPVARSLSASAMVVALATGVVAVSHMF
jgi:hypothetical protein